MDILAIDPGTSQSAYVLWDGYTISRADIVTNRALLSILSSINGFPGTCLIEMIGHYGTGMPAGKEVFDTCVWIGRFMEAWRTRTGEEPKLVMRGAIKLHHCQSARAKDPNIRQALIDKYGAPGTKKRPGVTYSLKSHLWAAFALATFWAETKN